MAFRQLIKILGHLIIRLSDFGKNPAILDLTGDRNIEWAWVVAHLPENPDAVLDFGCEESFLGLTAAVKGGDVTGLDIQKVHLSYHIDNFKIEKGDILNMDFGKTKFDVIINCSSIEHVGLAGRYNNPDVVDGDLMAMKRLRNLLKEPEGMMILTVPVAKDAVFPPWHRVYGTKRLHLLLRGFQIIKKEFWSKRSGRNVWVRVNEEEALAVQPSKTFYSLGCFILKLAPSER